MKEVNECDDTMKEEKEPMTFTEYHNNIVKDACESLTNYDDVSFSDLVVNYSIERSKSGYRLRIGTRMDDDNEAPIVLLFRTRSEAANWVRNNQLEIYATLLDHLEDKYDALKDNPSSSQRDAHWIFTARQDADTQEYLDGAWSCSNCLTEVDSSEGVIYPSGIRFCPQCGAHMNHAPEIEIENHGRWECISEEEI